MKNYKKLFIPILLCSIVSPILTLSSCNKSYYFNICEKEFFASDDHLSVYIQFKSNEQNHYAFNKKNCTFTCGHDLEYTLNITRDIKDISLYKARIDFKDTLTSNLVDCRLTLNFDVMGPLNSVYRYTQTLTGFDIKIKTPLPDLHFIVNGSLLPQSNTITTSNPDDEFLIRAKYREDEEIELSNNNFINLNGMHQVDGKTNTFAFNEGVTSGSLDVVVDNFNPKTIIFIVEDNKFIYI